MASISSEVATGRRMKGRDGLMRALRQGRAVALRPRAWRSGDLSLLLRPAPLSLALLHLLPARERVGIAAVQRGEELLAAFELRRVSLRGVEHALALLGRRAGTACRGARCC